MTYFIHSPFTPASFSREENRGLLIQFFLNAIFLSAKAPTADVVFPSSFPLFWEWAQPVGLYHQLQEHARLLSSAFPSQATSCQHIQQALEKMTLTNYKELCPLLCALTDPLILACQGQEHLVYFLLKHQEDLCKLQGPHYLPSLLERLHPPGIPHLLENVKEKFESRGFYLEIPPLQHAS